MAELAFFLQIVDEFEQKIWRTQAVVHHLEGQLILVFAAKLEKFEASIHNLLTWTIFLVTTATASQPIFECFANLTRD